MKKRKKGKSRKQRRSGNDLLKLMLYLLIKPIKLLLSFSFYLLKFIWLLSNYSMRLLHSLIKRLFKKKPSNPALSTLAEIDKMSGYKFEEFMKHVYEQLGYSVYHTPKSGDQGADLILTSKEKKESLFRSKGTRVRFQTVRYRKL